MSRSILGVLRIFLDNEVIFCYNILYKKLMESSMIVHGSINYSPCGRKRKTSRTKSRAKVNTSSMTPSFAMSDRLQRIQREQEKYPSLGGEKYIPQEDTQYKNEVSKRYTIAIAYNKGGYQVIGKDNIKDIGK